MKMNHAFLIEYLGCLGKIRLVWYCLWFIGVTFIGVTCLNLPSLVHGQNADSVDKDDWKSKIITQRSFDFGEVRLGSKATHSFEFSNPTEKNLVIETVASSCGCTIANVSNKTIAPGTTEKITIALNTEAFRGKRKSTIQVRFSEPTGHEIQLSVVVDIKNLMVDPEPLEFRAAEIAKPATRIITASRKGSPFWKIENISSSDPQLQARIVKREIRGNDVSYQIECTLEKEEATISKAELILKTNDSSEREYRVPVHIEAVEPVRASVATIDFGDAEVGSERKFIVSSVEPCELVRLSVSNDGFTISEINPAPKTNHILQVIRKSMEHTSATIEVETDVHKKVIVVEVVGKGE